MFYFEFIYSVGELESEHMPIYAMRVEECVSTSRFSVLRLEVVFGDVVRFDKVLLVHNHTQKQTLNAKNCNNPLPPSLSLHFCLGVHIHARAPWLRLSFVHRSAK